MSQRNPTDHEIDVYASEYILNDDQTACWRKAFPNSDASDESVWAKASMMHKMSKVQLRIEQKREILRKKDDKAFDMTVEQLKAKLGAVIEAGLSVDSSGKYQGLSAVNGAIAEFNKMAGNYDNKKATLNEVKFKFDKNKSYADQCADIVAAAAQGKISADVANVFISAIKSCVDIEESTVLKERIAALESLVN